MLFNSSLYIFVFLPLVFAVYFMLNRYGYHTSSRLFLLIASIYFYSLTNWAQLLRLLFLSMVFNYLVGVFLMKQTGTNRMVCGHTTKKILFVSAIVANLSALAYFKYMDFFIGNINWVLGTNYSLLYILLPLGISFVTFEEITYLTDSYLGKTRKYGFLHYALFVTFFPHLIAGPIVHHKEMMDQFDDRKNYFINWNNVASGLFLFTAGLFKKVMIADTFAVWVTYGFDQYQGPIGFFAGWAISLCYTLQLYFDFSGYTDMAIGVAHMFNIKLPINFNSPYKALNIQDFWKRWHITLSRFLRDYVYIPLGGSRQGEWRTYGNLFIVFLLGGLWHGAGWTFVIWGALHGVGIIIFKMWQKFNITLPTYAAWCIR
ncbi:MAG: MBOAT family O-acyltransferase [Candidatus Chromulinivorax sp.]|nr:MBOAT family O-acyltransferase [Candidatus Chromulinivorax sp.]